MQVVSVYWSPAVYGEQLIISMRNKTQVNGQNNFYFGLLESAKTPGQMFNEHFLAKSSSLARKTLFMGVFVRQSHINDHQFEQVF